MIKYIALFNYPMEINDLKDLPISIHEMFKIYWDNTFNYLKNHYRQ